MHADDTSYELGHGLQLGDLPLYVGGYFSFEYEDVFDKSRTVRLDDIALMLYGEQGRVGYMLELEANDIYSEALDGSVDDETVHSHMHIERMYLDYTFSDTLMLRTGKYNSPIGFWNLEPINVLRDTTSNPRITEILFPDFTTGFDMHYSRNDRFDTTMDLMLQATKDLDTLVSHDVYNNFDTDRHFGIGVSGGEEGWAYRLNAGYFHRVDEGNDYLYAQAAFRYAEGNYRIQGAVGTQGTQERSSIPYVGYLQGLYEPKEGHALILRAESYDDRITQQKDTFAVFGYTYRPLYPIAIKAEYQQHSLHDEEMLMLSLSVLF